MRRAAAWALVLGLALTARPVGAQDAGVAGAGVAAAEDGAEDAEMQAFRRMVDADPFTDHESDPIGTSASDAELRTMPLPEPEELAHERIPPQAGEILTAIPGVRAVDHRAEVELREGLAIVRERVRFASSARVPAEVRYRLAVPAGAALVALEACAHFSAARTQIGSYRFLSQVAASRRPTSRGVSGCAGPAPPPPLPPCSTHSWPQVCFPGGP